MSVGVTRDKIKQMEKEKQDRKSSEAQNPPPKLIQIGISDKRRIELLVRSAGPALDPWSQHPEL